MSARQPVITVSARSLLGSALWMALALVAALGAPSAAWAQVEVEHVGNVLSDTRMRVPGKAMPYDEDYAIIRADSIAQARVLVAWRSVEAVAHLRLRYTDTFNDVDTLEALTLRDRTSPYRFESDALYLSIYDFLVPGLDLRVGRQIVIWGTGDQFKPTSNLNSYLYDDRLEFGLPAANDMINLTYTAPWYVEGEEMTIFDGLYVQGVFVPVFRPGTVPDSGLLAFSSPSLLAQFIDIPLMRSAAELLGGFTDKGGVVTYDVDPQSPDLAAKNFQGGARLGATVLGVDLSVSYYYGFEDVARARRVVVDTGALPIPGGLIDTTSAEPDLGPVTELLGRLPTLEGVTVATRTELYYPRIHVLGADMATSLDALDGLGVRAEAALVFHDEERLVIDVPTADATLAQTVLEGGSFLKLNAGLTYSVTSWWLANVMYLRGFVDEFGASQLGDYVVAGSDFNLLDSQLFIRLFGVFNLNDGSLVVHPAISLRLWQNTDLMLGGLIYVGAEDTKFGSPVTGANTAILRAAFSF